MLVSWSTGTCVVCHVIIWSEASFLYLHLVWKKKALLLRKTITVKILSTTFTLNLQSSEKTSLLTSFTLFTSFDAGLARGGWCNRLNSRDCWEMQYAAVLSRDNSQLFYVSENSYEFVRLHSYIFGRLGLGLEVDANFFAKFFYKSHCTNLE